MENKSIKILCIDDNQDNLITLNALISEAFNNLQILTATSGVKGLELAAKEFPDVILLDIVMPDIDGFEVCEQLKGDVRLKDIPVIFVTALKDNKESRIRALEVGAEAFLAKPIDEIELKAQIRAMVKIKEANFDKHGREERLRLLVEEKTYELKAAHTAELNMLEDLKLENEQRKSSEEKLKQSEKDYRNLFENHSAVKLIVDPETGKIHDANYAAVAFYGWSIEELKNKTIQQTYNIPVSTKGTFAIIEQLLSFLTANKPFAHLIAAEQSTQDFVIALEKAYQCVWYETNLRDKLKDAIRDSLNTGNGHLLVR